MLALQEQNAMASPLPKNLPHLYGMPFLQRLQRIQERPLLLWLVLWSGLALLYLPAWKAGFQQDFIGWLELYHDSSFWGALNREGIPVHSFYQLTQLQLYLLTSLFGTQPVPWFLLFTALHALNGLLLFRLTRSVLQDLKSVHPGWVSLAGTLLVLFNPSMTEVVVWKASYHYLIAIQAILWMLLWARQYLLGGDAKWIVRSLLLMLALVFTLELWYTIPLLVLMLGIAYWRAGLVSKEQFFKAIARLVVPLFAILIAYLVVYRLVYGTWFAHTAFSSPGDDSVFVVAARVWAYEFNHLGMGRFFPNETRWLFMSLSGHLIGGCLAIAVTVILAEWAWRSYSRWPAEARALALYAAWALIALVPVLHYLPPDLFLIGNDRYLYFTAFFQWMGVAMLIALIFRRTFKARQVVFSIVLIVCLGFTAYLVMQWRNAAKVFWAVQHKFVWKDAPVVLILNMPGTYNGVGIIRGSDTSELPNHLRVFGKGIPRGAVYDVSSYNMQHLWDGAHVVVQDSTHLHVTLNQWGSWWQQYGKGALDRSTPLFDLHFIDSGHDYMLTLKQRPPGMVILYQQGLEWRAVDMNKIGIEQW